MDYSNTTLFFREDTPDDTSDSSNDDSSNDDALDYAFDDYMTYERNRRIQCYVE